MPWELNVLNIDGKGPVKAPDSGTRPLGPIGHVHSLLSTALSGIEFFKSLDGPEKLEAMEKQGINLPEIIRTALMKPVGKSSRAGAISVSNHLKTRNSTKTRFSLVGQLEPKMTAVLSPTALKYEDDDPLFEIVNGERVELPPMSILAIRVASKLHAKLGYFLEGKSLGEALVEALLHLPSPVDRNRRVDVAFASAQTIAQAAPQLGSENAWDLVPELMVEVVSPSDLAEEIIERVDEYFRAGTKLMWVVYPTQRLIHVFQSLRQIRVLGSGDELDGGSVLPGFCIPVVSLFPENSSQPPSL